MIVAMKRISSTNFSSNLYQIIIILFIVIFTFLMLFTFRSAQQSNDSLSYAVSAKSSLRSFHPHHLLYNPIVRLFYLPISSICRTCDVILAGQIHNILWAIVTILSFFYILKYLLGSSFAGLLGAIFLLITQGFWIFSTWNFPYIPAIGSLALLVALITIYGNTNFTFARIIMISLLLVLSIFYQQSNILFCIPLGYYLITTQRKQGWDTSITVLSIAGIIVYLAYFFVFLSISRERTFNAFLRYCLSYALSFHPQWGTFGYFSVRGIRSILHSQLWNFVFVAKSFKNVAINILAALIAGLFICNIRQIIKHAPYDKFRSFLLIWLIMHFLFFLWWLPCSRHHFVITLLPILLLTSLSLKDVMDKLVNSNFRKRITIAIIIFLIVFIAGTNFSKSILPLHRSRGRAYRIASRLAILVPKEYIICSTSLINSNLRYYFDRRRLIQAKGVLHHFYYSKPLPGRYLKNKECMVAPLSRIMPDYTIKIVNKKFNGYNHPAQWLEYIRWLFNLEYNPKLKRTTCRKFEVITVDKRVLYVNLGSSKMEVDSLKGLFKILDSQISKQRKENLRPFQKWYSTVYSES